MGIQKHFKAFHDTIKLGRKDDAYASAREKDDSIKEAIKKTFDESGYPVVDDFIQGSLAVHTGIKSRDTDFDIDRAIVIDSADAPENPIEPKRKIKDVLEKRGFTNVRIKKPCVTADYKALDLHIDFPVYKRSGTDYKLAVGKAGSSDENKEWADADPKRLEAWINDDSSYLGSKRDKHDQFRRLVRYVKRWRDHQFSEDVARKIYSIGLTVMIKDCFSPSFDQDGKPCDATALSQTLTNILSRGYFIQQMEEGRYRVKVALPVNPWRDIFDGSSVNTGTQLFNKLSRLRKKVDQALAENDEIKQCRILNEVFGDEFQVPDQKNESKTRKAAFATAGCVGTSQGA
ncbi:SMODS domain-containing nucleotidyltransferase [Marinobacter shengliensis]|uniref:Cyclic GMP-AMP synthase DncV-like nucleotidyltransferase n=1 Tax=Marinobacter shengliensis TaxID=1389223 RepID=A0ABV4W7Q0_9GAMM